MSASRRPTATGSGRRRSGGTATGLSRSPSRAQPRPRRFSSAPPDPFATSHLIEIDVPAGERARVTVLNVLGRQAPRLRRFGGGTAGSNSPGTGRTRRAAAAGGSLFPPGRGGRLAGDCTRSSSHASRGPAAQRGPRVRRDTRRASEADHEVLVVEDEPGLNRPLSISWRGGSLGRGGERWPRGDRPRRRGLLRPRAARPHAPPARRHRGLPPAQGALARPLHSHAQPRAAPRTTR